MQMFNLQIHCVNLLYATAVEEISVADSTASVPILNHHNTVQYQNQQDDVV
jgi:hypothetical protein